MSVLHHISWETWLSIGMTIFQIVLLTAISIRLNHSRQEYIRSELEATERLHVANMMAADLKRRHTNLDFEVKLAAIQVLRGHLHRVHHN
jgi:hypothetical protein